MLHLCWREGHKVASQMPQTFKGWPVEDVEQKGAHTHTENTCRLCAISAVSVRKLARNGADDWEESHCFSQCYCNKDLHLRFTLSQTIPSQGCSSVLLWMASWLSKRRRGTACITKASASSETGCAELSKHGNNNNLQSLLYDSWSRPRGRRISRSQTLFSSHFFPFLHRRQFGYVKACANNSEVEQQQRHPPYFFYLLHWKERQNKGVPADCCSSPLFLQYSILFFFFFLAKINTPLYEEFLKG